MKIFNRSISLAICHSLDYLFSVIFWHWMIRCRMLDNESGIWNLRRFCWTFIWLELAGPCELKNYLLIVFNVNVTVSGWNRFNNIFIPITSQHTTTGSKILYLKAMQWVSVLLVLERLFQLQPAPRIWTHFHFHTTSVALFNLRICWNNSLNNY